MLLRFHRDWEGKFALLRASEENVPKWHRSKKYGRGKFVPGLKLSELYYDRVVAPIVEKKFPHLKYSAALLGSGSEVLGYDTEQSMDHNWGPRLFLFLSDEDLRSYKSKIDRELRKSLPTTFMGHPTSFGEPDENGARLLDFTKRKSGDVNHYIIMTTIRSFFEEILGVDLSEKIENLTWLALPQQRLLEITSGKIFRDDIRLKAAVDRFRYYPRDIWLYLMAAQWSKISQEEAFVGRASSVGDEAGSRIIASRIAKELMELCFLMEKKYTPYSKWLGRAFSRLEISTELRPVIEKVLESGSIDIREKWLSEAYRVVAQRHNSLKITREIPTKVSRYYNRPYPVIHADRFAGEIRKKIRDERIRRLLLIGSVDQITENPLLLNDRDKLKQIRILYR